MNKYLEKVAFLPALMAGLRTLAASGVGRMAGAVLSHPLTSAGLTVAALSGNQKSEPVEKAASITNKYLEKIAGNMKAMKAARLGVDGYQLKAAIDKKRKKAKKKMKPTINSYPARKFNKR